MGLDLRDVDVTGDVRVTRPESGYGMIRLAGALPYEVISVSALVDRLTGGAIVPDNHFLEHIPVEEVRTVTDAFERALVQELPVRMDVHLIASDGTPIAMNGWCHNIVHDMPHDELCCVLIPEEAGEEQLRSSVRDAFVAAFSLTYDNIYEVSHNQRLIRCLKSSSLLPSKIGQGMRVSLPDVVEHWLTDVVVGDDRDEVKRFFLSSLSYLASHGDQQVVRKEFRVLLDTGEPAWCEGALVPFFEDSFLFCCRDISSKREYAELEDERDTLQNEGRLLRAALSEGSSLSMVFDALTGKRIFTSEDINLTGVVGINSIDDMVDALRRRTRAGGLPSEIERRYDLGMPRAALESDDTTHFEWKMYDHAGDYHLFRVTFLRAEPVGQSHAVIYVVIRDIEGNERTSLWEQGQESGSGSVGVMSRAGFENHCRNRRHANEPEVSGYLFLLEADDFWAYTLDEQDEMVNAISATLGGLSEGYEVVVAAIHRSTFLVCADTLNNELAAEEFAHMLKGRVDSALVDHGGAHASVGFAFAKRDARRGYRASFELANRALRAAQQAGGNQVTAYHSEMPERAWSHPAQLEAGEGGPFVEIRTFGYFDVFVDGRPVLFKRNKTKELLALIVDRRGGFVNSREAVTYLWEDAPINKMTLARYRKTAMYLRETLEEYDISDIIVAEGGKRRLNVSRVSCDLLDYLSGDPHFKNLFNGTYLLNYSWAEITTGQLETARQQMGSAAS